MAEAESQTNGAGGVRNELDLSVLFWRGKGRGRQDEVEEVFICARGRAELDLFGKMCLLMER